MRKNRGLTFNYLVPSKKNAMHYGLKDLTKIECLGNSNNLLAPQLDTEIFNVCYNNTEINADIITVKDLIIYVKKALINKTINLKPKYMTNNNLFRKDIYSINSFKDIKEPVWSEFNDAVIEFDGDFVRLQKDTYLLYKKSIKCCCCGLEGSYFAKEKRKKEYQNYVLSLYGELDDREIIFTKDHIIPKSKDGANDISNYQTMCIECNGLKGDDETLSLEELKERVDNYRLSLKTNIPLFFESLKIS